MKTGMKTLSSAILGTLILAATMSAQAQTPSDGTTESTCVTCHLALGDDMAKPVELIRNDVHGRKGISCVDCHGGDPRESDLDRSMDVRRGFVGKPTPAQIPGFCGKCHSSAEFMKRFNPSLRVDQQAEYSTSVHGKRLAQGDTRVATCVSCHGNHGVLDVKDPNSPVYATHVATTCAKCHSNAETMKPYGIPVDQEEKYLSSVHAQALLKKQDLSAPTCNDCHGNHGAAPPQTTSVTNVCGTCHVRQAEIFDVGAHKDAFDALGIPQCLACHGNHEVRHPTDTLLGTGPNSACIKCHDKGEPGYETATAMYQQLTLLDGAIGNSGLLLDRAARAGMEVSSARFELNDARDKLINARVVVHSFSADELDKAVAPGLELAQKARQDAENALAELQFRRKGLAVSLLLIALAVLSVYLKIREIERPTSRTEDQ